MATDVSMDGLRRVGDAAGQPVYYDDGDGTYHAWYDASTAEPVSTTLSLLVSSALDVDPLEMEPLAATVDPDALDAIVDGWQAERGSRGAVSFSFVRCGVTVHDSGEIVVEPTDRSLEDDRERTR